MLRKEIKFLKKRIKFRSKSKTTAIGKSFVKNQINRKYFSAQQYQNSGNFDIKHLRRSKTDLSKEIKKMF